MSATATTSTPNRTASATARPDRDLMNNPPMAWPTLGLFSACVALWVTLIGVGISGIAPLWALVPVLTAIGYALFTPMHDSAHGSVGRARWINAIVGRACAFILMAPFHGFKVSHLRHHKKTNEAHEDPDMWSGGGRVWTLPLRWLTQDIHYYVVYARLWSERPLAERIEVVTTAALVSALAIALSLAGFGLEVLFLWAIPARLAIAILAFSFDYLPHWPHGTAASDDRFKATHNIDGGPLLTALMFFQNYHLIHHLHPGVPFYRYGALWRARKEALIPKGARTRALWNHAQH